LSQECVDDQDQPLVSAILQLKVKPVHLQSYHEAFNRLLTNNKTVRSRAPPCLPQLTHWLTH